MFRALPARIVVTSTEALAELLRSLNDADYEFIAVTPATHQRVLKRELRRPPSLRDIFGWNRPFDPSDLDARILALIEAANAIESYEGKQRSRFRIASLGDDLMLHSSFPTDDVSSVFFGPDTYRFVRFIERNLPDFGEAERLVDMGAGSGAGAIASARMRGFAAITMVDSNVEALRLAAVNCRAAGVNAEFLHSTEIPPGPDLIIGNPPYMMDRAGRSYRDGGAVAGGEVALDWTRQALAGLAPGGAMLLYTGAAYINGEAPLLQAIASACREAEASLTLQEIDPDVFGEELEEPGYEDVERIAAVGAVIRTRND